MLDPFLDDRNVSISGWPHRKAAAARQPLDHARTQHFIISEDASQFRCFTQGYKRVGQHRKDLAEGACQTLRQPPRGTILSVSPVPISSLVIMVAKFVER